jgi:hypothetical protein
MSQHDYVIADQAGLAVLADINDALAAIASNNSGLAAPTTTFAHMWWADTTAGVLKRRNTANNAWISVMSLTLAISGFGEALITAVDAAAARATLGADAFPAGTKMLFQQTNAPTGWTKDTTHNDKALRVVSGAAGSGGTAAFSTVMASRTPAGAVGGTALTEAQLPAHAHAMSANSSGSDNLFAATYTTTSVRESSVTAASGTKNNGTQNTGGGATHTHSFTGTAMDFAVQYVDLIIATKN